MTRSLQRHLLCSAALALLSLQAAHAADTAPAPAAAPNKVSADKLGPARQLIASRQWAEALQTLQKVNDTSSADWNNLMGYTLRKQKSADLDASERFYNAALNIDPHHRDAMEYSGELYLMKGDLVKAQARLATLTAECGTKGCAQLNELQSAIDRYKAQGNKFVPNW